MSDLDKRAEEVEARLAALAQTGAKYHLIGDRAAVGMTPAAPRRVQRNAASLNRECRAVGQAVEATIWLAKVLRDDSARRGGNPLRMLDAVDRLAKDAAALVDDLEFDAVHRMQQPPNLRRVKKKDRG